MTSDTMSSGLTCHESPYRLAARESQPEWTNFTLRGAAFGPGRFSVIAGPCAVESEEQLLRIARAVKASGAHMLRGGAFKPRTSPYGFQGLGVDGLKILKAARDETGLPFVTEAVDLASLEHVYEYADMIQIGARNMQNYALLREVGKLDKPVMLKRGVSATVDEWLLAAEYIMMGGNRQILLCERGIRTYDKHTRNLVDLGVVPVVQALSHLPVAVDPSHGTGRKDLVGTLAKASMAVGAQAVMIEVHDRPLEALCDGPQAISPEEIVRLMKSFREMAPSLQVEIL
jgi:3-deoxy-7-phosphoheptulonate synthase